METKMNGMDGGSTFGFGSKAKNQGGKMEEEGVWIVVKEV
jgi:hypothetical protein